MKFILFRKAKKTKAEPASMFSIVFGESFTIPGEEWKDDKSGEKTALEFVCFAEDPKEIAKAVRKAPLDRYLLFKGEAVEIKVAMPVFAGGVSLETLMDEWGEK